MLVPLPGRMREYARFEAHPVSPKAAATVAIVRDGASGIEVFLMRRRASMAFAAGMYVFPGGGVHEEDAAELPWAGPDAAHFAEHLGCSLDTARALVVSAVRETFEETGVLLAGSDAHSVVADVSPFYENRCALEAREVSFARFLRDNGLVLRADLLAAWAHWITPAFEPRRYDTRFFVAVLPEGQHIDTVSGEADRSEWAPIGAILALLDRGETAMMLPTAATCRELSAETAATVLRTAASRRIRPIEPRLVEFDGELWLDTDEGQCA